MVDAMTTRMLLETAWDIDSSVVFGCVLLLVVYFWRVRCQITKAMIFTVGVAVLFVALESPLDALADNYLFSAHMLQHLLLILIVPPFLLLGIPLEEANSWLLLPIVRKAEGVMGRPSVAWASCIVVMTVWHVPILYNFALAHESVHIFQHLSFLITGTMFWWPIVSPIPGRRLAAIPAVFYLFAAVIENTVLGITITFMPVGYYPAYLHPHASQEVLDLIRNGWGISAALDQKLGGLLMWVPGCSVYFVGILLELARWYSAPELESQAIDLQAYRQGVSR